MEVQDILGHLGLAPNVAALIWAAYGGWLFAEKVRNGKGKNGHDSVQQFRVDLVAEVREALESAVTRIDLDAREREVERREHEQRRA